LGARILLGPGSAAETASHFGINATEADYHAHRIALGVPEGGKDYAFGDIFPHDANFDLLNGVSFTKGCFVGQEVVSRMQHRAAARKRIVIIEGDAPLASGSEITAGPSTIGTIGSVAGNLGLALVRLDRAEEAQSKGEPLAASGSPVRLRLPEYLEAAAAASTP
jgi:folate-binding protein YgfZ